MEPGQFALISMGLIRYSCGHISGPHEPIPTKFGLWMFSSCSTNTWYPKCWNAKQAFCDVITSVLYKTNNRGVGCHRQKKKEKQCQIWVKCQTWVKRKEKKTFNFDSTKFVKKRSFHTQLLIHTPRSQDYARPISCKSLTHIVGLVNFQL